jgi:ubiquinone biosynthesis protein COQ9
MLDDNSKRDRIIKAALHLAESKGWRALTLAEIASEANVSLAEVHKLFPGKTAILEAFIEKVDAEVLNKAKVPAMETPARDRIFEVLMTRFDVLKPYKAALARIRADYICAPPGPGTARLLCASANSQKWMLAAAGVPTSGGKGCVRVSGMMCLTARVVPVWFKDEDPDLAKTMAALDRELREGERWLKRLDAIVGDLGRIACRFVARRRERPSDGGGAGPAPKPPPTPEPGPASMTEQPGAG